MRILFSSFGAYGHVFPLVPLAMAGGATETAAAYGGAFGRIVPGRTIADLRPVFAAGDVDLVVHGLGTPGAAVAGRLAGVPTAVAR